MRYLPEFKIASAPARGTGQDRVAAFERDGALVIVLADGAGGTGDGAAAAQAVIDAVAREDGEPEELLALLDERIASIGLTTAVIVRVAPDGIVGASVGDSGAWIVKRDGIVDLTEHQRRKPLVGDGCVPVGFRAPPLGDGDTLVVASDGLVRYAASAQIAQIVRETRDLRAAGEALIDLVRLPGGVLQDDVTIVLCNVHG